MDARVAIREIERGVHPSRRTRYYHSFEPTGNGEFRLDTYAVITWRGGPLIKLVGQLWSDRDIRRQSGCVVHNDIYNFYAVNWGGYAGFRCDPTMYDIRWEGFGRQLFMPHGRWLNGLDGTRYEHCGWTHRSPMNIKDYICAWNRSHAVEFLAKAGLFHLVTPSFVGRLKEDREFFKFFREHAKELPSARISHLTYAFNHGMDIGRAGKLLGMRREWRGVAPKRCDIAGFFRWAERNDVGRRRYDDYLSDCATANMHPVVCPSAEYMDEVAMVARGILAENDRLRRIREREELAKAKAEIRRVRRICGLLKSEMVFGEWTAKLLRTQRDYIAEGRKMHNCIGRVWTTKNTRNGMIFSIRFKGETVADMRMDGDLSISECRAKFNRDASPEAMEIADRVADAVREMVA